MSQIRYQGTLKKWDTERGFGFITAADGGQDIFVHITAFVRDGRQPKEGEALTFEVEPDRKGKRSAVRVKRPGDPVGPVARALPVRHLRSDDADTNGFFGKLVGLLLVCALLLFGYNQYSKRVAKYEALPGGPLETHEAVLPSPPVSLATTKLPVPPGFKCDGRSLCSQMTSCNEATLFLQNCPGMSMDGNGDGVPCEQQWCKK